MYCITSVIPAQTQYDPLCLLHCGATVRRRCQAQKRSLQSTSPVGSCSSVGRASSLSSKGAHREDTSRNSSAPLLLTRDSVQLFPAHAIPHVCSFSRYDNELLKLRSEPRLCRDSGSTAGSPLNKNWEKSGHFNTCYMFVRCCAFNSYSGLGQLDRVRRIRTYAFNPQNGGGPGGRGGGGGDFGRIIINLAGAGFLTYLTITGRLNWLFDTIFTLWLVSAVVWWFAERSLIKGPCPNCGGEFQVFEFSLKDEPRLCPYCSQPFKLENKTFVRDEPQFSNQQTRGFNQPFGGFGGFEDFGRQTSSRKREDGSGVIVDVEAEVRDKD